MLTHQIEKIKREPVRRTLTVVSKKLLTPKMLRIEFQSDELNGFESLSPDDHIKLFFTDPGANLAEPSAKRDFTPRAWNCQAGTFTLDFALHDQGVATQWARSARVGDPLEIGGPRGSTVVPDDFDWYLLIGDACALPSFSRRLQSLRAHVPVRTLVMVADEQEEQTLSTLAANEMHWLRSAATSAEEVTTVLTALGDPPLPAGDGFIWIAAETDVARELYRYFVDQFGHPAKWIKASAYWTRS